MAQINKTKGNYTTVSPFPIDTTTFDDLQNNVSLVEKIARLAGGNCVIEGLETDGAEGTVILNGEVLHADAGQGAYLVLKQETVNVAYNGGQTNGAYTRKRLEWASAQPVNETSYTRADFATLDSWAALKASVAGLRAELAAVQPEAIGTIKMWPSATVGPGGVLFSSENSKWKLCDGSAVAQEWTDLRDLGITVNLPNMKGRFVCGYNSDNVDYDTISKTGGKDRVTLQLHEIPPHSHVMNPRTWLNNGSYPADWDNCVLRIEALRYNLGNQVTWPAGGGQPHENRPPYIVMAYIIKVKL